MRSLTRLTFLLLLSVSLAPSFTSAVPLLVDYRGSYTEAGAAVNGSRNFRFQLYPVASGGSALWDSGVTSLPVNKGYYNFVLGSGVPLTASLFTNTDLYLQVEVQAATFGPRERFTATVFAFNALMIDGKTPGQKGANYLVYADNNGRVGIGTNNPQERLHVNKTLACETNTMLVKNVEMALVPQGLIVMWSGTLAAIPQGWKLCDGTLGTPDLRNRFVMGVQTAENPGSKGGTNSLILTSAQLPSHTHTGNTAVDGGHTGHYYGYFGGMSFNQIEVDAGLHSHSFTTDPAGSSLPVNNRPSFYKLAFIMRQ